MPRTPKQYFRYALTKFGLFNETAFRLVMDEIRGDDTFLVSFPKSGNTWVRFLVANLLHPKSEIHFANIDSYIPDVYSAIDTVNAMASPRMIKTHHPEYEAYPKSLYIVRDYRDVLVSYFHFHVSLGSFFGTFKEFVRSVDKLHPFGSWSEHVLGAYAFRDQHPERMLIVRYEDLLENTATELERIANFLNCQPEVSFEAVAEKCRFDALKRIEQEHGSEFLTRSGQHFFREGKSGKWVDRFDTEDIEYLLRDEKTKSAFLTAGYSIT